MIIFALLKGYAKFKEIFGWMIYNKNNPILKEIFDKNEIKMPSKSTLHNILDKDKKIVFTHFIVNL